MCLGVSARHPCARVCFITVILCRSIVDRGEGATNLCPTYLVLSTVNRDLTSPEEAFRSPQPESLAHLERTKLSGLRARRWSRKPESRLRYPENSAATHRANSTCEIVGHRLSSRRPPSDSTETGALQTHMVVIYVA